MKRVIKYKTIEQGESLENELHRLGGFHKIIEGYTFREFEDNEGNIIILERHPDLYEQ